MFSCRSERKPCCGPKSAVSVQSPDGEAIRRVDDPAVDRGGIADEADALAGDELAIGTVEQSFEAEADGHRADYSRRRRARVRIR